MKNNKLILEILAIVVIAIGACIYVFSRPSEINAPIQNISVMSPKDATYIIDGKSVTLKNGLSSVPAAPGSEAKIITQYFGNEVTYDLDNDGRKDSAFIITQNTGGSGTFFYFVAALNTVNGYVGSHALLLGDRIAPQTTEMGNGRVIIVNYADRKAGESFAVQPSVGKSIWLLLDPKTMQFGEVEQNFSGEANPEIMTLQMKTWNWVNTKYSDNTVVTPRSSKIFSITFEGNKTFSITTDCNNGGGKYTQTGKNLIFSEMVSTLMACITSQEGDFTKMLGDVNSFKFTSKGELVLGLKNSSGSMYFR